MALRTAERLGGSSFKQLGKAVLVYQAAHGHLLGVHLPALANQPPDSQVRGLQPRDLKRYLIETPSSTQVEQYDLLQKNRSPVAVKPRCRHASGSSLAKHGNATRAQTEAGKVDPSVQAISKHVLLNIANTFHNLRSIPIELARSAASKAN